MIDGGKISIRRGSKIHELALDVVSPLRYTHIGAQLMQLSVLPALRGSGGVVCTDLALVARTDPNVPSILHLDSSQSSGTGRRYESSGRQLPTLRTASHVLGGPLWVLSPKVRQRLDFVLVRLAILHREDLISDPNDQQKLLAYREHRRPISNKAKLVAPRAS